MKFPKRPYYYVLVVLANCMANTRYELGDSFHSTPELGSPEKYPFGFVHLTKRPGAEVSARQCSGAEMLGDVQPRVELPGDGAWELHSKSKKSRQHRILSR